MRRPTPPKNLGFFGGISSGKRSRMTFSTDSEGEAFGGPSGKIVTARPAVRVEASVISLISIRIRVEDNPWAN
jgi:hypothetical protein